MRHRTVLREAALALLALLALLPAPHGGGEERTAAGEESVTLRLEPVGGETVVGEPASRPPLAGRLHLRHAGGEAVAKPERAVEVDGTAVRLALPASTWWQARLEAAGWWSPPVMVASGGGEVRLPVRRTGRVAVAVRPPRGSAPPEELSVHFRPPPRGVLQRPGDPPPPAPGVPLRGTVPCRRPEPGADAPPWLCELPAATHDLRFHAPGFASVFRPAAVVEPGGRAELAPLELVPGGALFGSVEWPAGDIASGDVAPGDVAMGDVAPGDVRIRLTPMTLEPPAPRVRSRTRTVHPSARGIFQFRGLPAGTYRLSADAPGTATVERRSIRVYAGRETELRPALALRPPARAEICVTPPAPPGPRRPGDTWKLVLHPERTRVRPPVRGFVAASGCWTTPELPPGAYRLVVEDGRGSVWGEEPVTLEPGPGLHHVEPPLVPIAGEVTRGGHPLRARLHFRRATTTTTAAAGRPGAPTVIVYADPEGRFHGALPAAGRWDVGAAFSADGAVQALWSVEIEPPARGAVELRFEVPDVALRGRVVDTAGSPVADAGVHLLPAEDGPEDGMDAGMESGMEGGMEGGPGVGSEGTAERRGGVSRAVTGDDGRFLFDAVVPGAYTVSVLAAAGTAAAEVTVRERPPPAELEIVLVGEHRVSGLVVGPDGPVLGAQVQAYPELPRFRRTPVERATTDGAGHFQLDVPADAVGLHLLVLPPGHAARAVRVAADPGRPLLVPVDTLAGTLVLRSGDALPASTRLFVDGVPVFLAQLREWAAIQGGTAGAARWVLPGMAAATYALCPPPADCPRTHLPPAGTATLHLTADPPAE